MLAIIGTVPVEGFPLVKGKVNLKDDHIEIEGKRISINRGTPALIAAAINAGYITGQSDIFAYLVGDIGLGDGSRYLYEYLSKNLHRTSFDTLAFHYLQPDADWHNRVLFAIEDMKKRPGLIADAGFMYAAKMSGQAPEYDLFTPDAGELAFLADEEAPHPFYTRGFILHDGNDTPELIKRAYEHDNAARNLIVKGKKDYIADRNGIHAVIENPSEEAMEAIGGTGDTLTGIVSLLIDSGIDIIEASETAARTNRLAGSLTRPDPATQIIELIRHIPEALQNLFDSGRQNTNDTISSQKTITPEMTVLDIVSKYRETEQVFKKYDEKAGECICCNALFSSLAEVSEDYGIELSKLLSDLRN